MKRLLAQFTAEYRLSLLTGYGVMLAAMVTQVALVPVYLATLGVEGFGTLTLIISVITYAAVGVGWLTGGLMRILGSSHATGQFTEFVQSTAAAKIIFLIYAALLATLAVVWAAVDGRLPVSVMIVAGLYFIANQEIHVERLALSASGRLPFANVVQLTQIVLYCVSVIVALRLGGGLLSVFACYLLSTLAARALVPLAGRERPPSGTSRREAIQALLSRLAGKFGGGYLLASAIVASSQLDIVLVAVLGGVGDVTQFVLIWKIAEFAVQLLWRIPEMMAPSLIHLDARQDALTLRKRYTHIVGLTVAAALAAGPIYAFFGPWILRVWIGPDYAPQDPLGFYLAGACIVWAALARPTGVLAEALARFRLAHTVALVAIGARLILIVALYPRFGYLAPLVALTVVNLCGAPLAYFLAGRRLLAGW